jgi:lipopolysaccharide heptosyltransferase II
MLAVDVLAEKIKKVLVIRMSAIGDVILTLPVLEALAERWPSARIDYVLKGEFAELVRWHPAVNNIWEFERSEGLGGLRRLAGAVAAEDYDLVVDLHRNPRSIYLRWRGAGRMMRVYRKQTWQRMLLKTLGMNLLRDAAPVCDRYFTALEDFGITRSGRRPMLHLDEGALAAVSRVFADAGIGAADRLIAVAPGASYPTKQWGGEGFIEAAAALAGRDYQVIVLGGGRDREVAAEVAGELNRRGIVARDFAGRLKLIESAAALKRSALLLTNDSGLMHAGDALAVPLVAIFGPTSRELGFYPLGPRSRVVETGLACRPCTLHGDQKCKKGHHRCMTEISAQDVIAAAREILNETTDADQADI